MKKMLAYSLIIALLLLSACSSGGQYKRISLSSEMLGDKLDIMQTTLVNSTKVECTAQEIYSDKMPVYEISPRTISREEFQIMADFWGIDSEITNNSETLLAIENMESPSKSMSLTDNHFTYRNGTGIYAMTQTDEELETEAKAIFDTLPLIEGEYEYLGVTSEQTVYANDENYIVSKRVSFRRLIDGVRVIGNDICDLYFNSDGLYRVEIKFYDYEKTGELDMLSLDDAVDKVKTPDAFVLYSDTNRNFSGAADKLKIERTKLLFVNQYSNGCEILQPVFNLTGTAENEGGSVEFAARIIAIPERYTHE